jgi:cellulose synthase/poly-beta-1,6-N-acetylglucosamine synthase-like glycosyltransferase
VTDVSVIVPVRNAAPLLDRCLAALGRQDYDGDFEVIVVDDGSSDSSAAVAEAAAVRPRVVRLRGGAGPGVARAAGAAEARAPVLAFTDADCEPIPGWLRAGARALAGADLVQGRTLPPEGAQVGPYDRQLAVVAEWGLYESANLFVRRELYERAGGFDEGFEAPTESFSLGRRHGQADSKHMGEDVSFGWRARRAGARTAFCDEALVYHAVFPRDAAGFLAERMRVRHFPAIARHVPELRDAFFWRRWFLSGRTAAFDAALAGAALAAWRRSPLPLAAALPYARKVKGDWRQWGPRRGVRVAAVYALADAVGFVSLVRGSARSRSLVL